MFRFFCNSNIITPVCVTLQNESSFTSKLKENILSISMKISFENAIKLRLGCRVRGVFLSRLASIQTQAKNLYKCKRDSAIWLVLCTRENEIDAFELALYFVASGRYSTFLV